MSRHHTLRLAVLTAVAAGALLAPVSAAFAADPTPSASTGEDLTAAEKKIADAKEARAQEAKKAEAAKAGKDLPRGGVAAGEAPASDSGDSTAALAGSAAGAVLLAGAGTFVLRRRAAGRHNA
ncbi:hypothetical protein OG562_12275 [Streptomyces sp. NBC_01275]|uniref:hypothetical protein n=1 Tax=Streptomyces sp. NBC_01275 TaxID=2903807 RepID=UPI0022533945|nr:hypothetical protein [Streptomyces sp. NBC_01275]MCX4761738.1 hypothetical protein [Streptomyces sp. NBC_01275]